MSSQSSTGAPDDAFVDQLGDRLSTDHSGEARPPEVPRPFAAPPPARPRAQVPPSAAFPPPHQGFGEDNLTDRDQGALASPPVDHQPGSGGGDPFAEFEDDLQGESTRIDTDHLLAEEATSILHQAPERPFLRVAKGKDQGKEFFLNPGETGVGRSIDNDVILTDIAVSRRHLQIHMSEAGFLKIVDLGSGNGSTVNGHRVKEAPLNQGDRIELGETTLVVEIPGGPPQVGAGPMAAAALQSGNTTDEEAPPSLPPGVPTAGVPSVGFPPQPGAPVATDYIPAPAPASPGPFGIPKPWLFAFLAIGGVIVALVGATVTALLLRDDGELTDDHAKFNQGVEAFDSHRWDDAEAAFNEHFLANQTDEATQQYLARIGQVRRDLAAIERAEAALASEPPDGRGAMGELANISTDSPVYAETVVPLKERANEAHVASLREAGIAAARSGDREAANEQQDLLRDFEHESAQAAIADIDRALGGEETVVASTMRRRSGSSSSSSASSSSGSRRSTMSSGSSSSGRSTMSTGGSGLQRAQREVIAIYVRGDFDQAASRARALAADQDRDADHRALNDLAERINRFKRAYAATQSRNASTSQLRAAIRLDDGISGGRYSDPLRARLVDASLVAARAAIGRNDYQRGCRAVRDALNADRGNSAARTLASQCSQRAAQMLTQARSRERSNPQDALNLYRQIVNIVPEGDPSYRPAYSAKNRLASQLRDEDE